MKLRRKCREIQRVALYLRVSTDEQTQGHSLDSQHQELTDWACSEGWEVAEVYEDAGASGTTVAGRPSFLRMVRDAQAGAFDAILVLRVDRFARSVRDSAVYRELLSDCGVQLKSKTEPSVGDDTPAGFLTNGMFDVMAAYYSRLLSHNVERGMRTRAYKGLPLGDTPFGYCSESAGEPPQVVPKEAEAVRRAFEQYAGGNCSMLDIADGLNAAGFRPRSKRGRLVFSKATVRGMLSNPIYVGDITHHGEVIGEGKHEPIVSRALWDQVQRIREQRAWRPQMYGARPSRPYLLSGVGLCAECGSPLWANSTGGGRHCYYRCASRSRGDECQSGGASCRADEPEAIVSGLFGRLELPAEWQERVRLLTTESASGVDVDRERRRLEDKIERVRRGLLDGVLDNETAKAAVREAEAALAALPRSDEAEINVGEVLTDIRELWPRMTGEERRDLVRLVLSEVAINLRTGEVKGMLPKPTFAPLFRILAEEEGGLISVCGWRPRGEAGPPCTMDVRRPGCPC